MKTGKPILHNDFRNKHWSNTNGDSNADNNAIDNISESITVDIEENAPVKKCRYKATNKCKSQSCVNWDIIFADIQIQRNYNELENYVMSLDYSKFENLFRPIVPAHRHFTIDKVALHSMPPDCPKDLVPIYTTGDSNCLPRALSTALSGFEDNYNILHQRILIENVQNKNYYLSNSYLSNGTTIIHSCGTFPQQYTVFSDQFFHHAGGNIDDIVEVVYEKERLSVHNDGSFMGMWKLWAACNIIQRPIVSAFPVRGSPEIRADFN